MGCVTEDVLENLTTRIVDALRPERIYLFGSYAYGTPDPDSDIDLLVVISSNGEHLRRSDGIVRHAIGDVGYGVDVVMRTAADFDRRASWPSSLEATVQRKGRLLHGA